MNLLNVIIIILLIVNIIITIQLVNTILKHKKDTDKDIINILNKLDILETALYNIKLIASATAKDVDFVNRYSSIILKKLAKISSKNGLMPKLSNPSKNGNKHK